MAVATTGAIYKSLSFDGVESRNFGVYITGEAVYNAPQRDVEMISIPGRSGAFALDKGRFENIEVTYPAGIFADNEADFAQAVSDFRNYLCSRNGYCRLVDEYNPEEYRMAIYKSGLDVSPAQLKAGEFDITFDCKPQRYLMSGEAAVEVSDGDTLMNPTLFESSPLLEVEGYGTIGFNGYEVELEDALMGEVTVVEDPRVPTPSTDLNSRWNINRALYNTGDTLTWKPTHLQFRYDQTGAYNIVSYVCTSVTQRSGSQYSSGWSYEVTQETNTSFRIDFYFPQFVSSTEAGSFIAYGIDVNTRSTFADSSSSTATENNTVQFGFTASSSKGRYSVYLLCSNLFLIQGATLQFASVGDVVADSTIPVAGHPTYIDCEIGECYKYEDGSVVSLDKYVDLGSNLPTLASGVNTITYDDTFTSVKVTPRWWKV